MKFRKKRRSHVFEHCLQQPKQSQRGRAGLRFVLACVLAFGLMPTAAFAEVANQTDATSQARLSITTAAPSNSSVNPSVPLLKTVADTDDPLLKGKATNGYLNYFTIRGQKVGDSEYVDINQQDASQTEREIVWADTAPMQCWLGAAKSEKAPDGLKFMVTSYNPVTKTEAQAGGTVQNVGKDVNITTALSPTKFLVGNTVVLRAYLGVFSSTSYKTIPEEERAAADVYVFTVKRRVALSSLQVKNAEGELLGLEPSFSLNDSAYRVVDTNASTVTVTPTAKTTVDTRITVNDKEVKNGEPYEVDLSTCEKTESGNPKIVVTESYTGTGKAEGSTYTIVVTDGTADHIPSITSQPRDVVCGKRETPTLEVSVEEPTEGTLSYQWYGRAGANSIYGPVAGATGKTLNLSESQTRYAGTDVYYCRITNTVDGITYSTRSDDATVTTEPTFATAPVLSNLVFADRTYTKGTSQTYRLYAEATVLDKSFSAVEGSKGSWKVKIVRNTRRSLYGAEEVPWESRSANSNRKAAEYFPPVDEAGTYYYFAVAEERVVTPSGEVDVAQSDSLALPDGVAKITIREFDAPWKGAGTKEDPWMFSTMQDLLLLSQAANEDNQHFENNYFKLANDIVVEADNWDPISEFQGTFDGNGHTVTHSYGSKPLFGRVIGADIGNLKLKGQYIDGNGLINGFVQSLNHKAGEKRNTHLHDITIVEGTTIKGSGLYNDVGSSAYETLVEDCVVESGVRIGWNSKTNAPNQAGKFVGEDRLSNHQTIGSFVGAGNGQIRNCQSYADVYGGSDVGGIVGRQGQSMTRLRVVNCVFGGHIHATGDFVGGIAGSGYAARSAPNGTCVSIVNCLVTGTVEGTDCVGGVFGGEPGVNHCISNGIGSIKANCFVGEVKATEDNARIGSIAGFFLGINSCNQIQDNVIKANCGASMPVGGADLVNTRGVETRGYNKENGVYYFDGSNEAEVATMKEWGGTYTSITGNAVEKYWGVGYNGNYVRNDDPFGVDTSHIARIFTANQLAGNGSDSAVAYLNSLEVGNGNWEAVDGIPALSPGAYPVSLSIAGDYKATYTLGENFDLSGATLTVTYSDGSQTYPPSDSASIQGFNPEGLGTQAVVVTLKNVSTVVYVNVVQGEADNPKGKLPQGTVYLSVSKDKRFAVSDGDTAGVVMANIPVDLADIAAVDLSHYGLTGYDLPSPEGSETTFEASVLQLFLLANEQFSAAGANGIVFSGTPGSLYLQSGFFGWTDNLTYYVNGLYPLSDDAWGATCDRIALRDGDRVDVALYTDRNWYTAPDAGYHFFKDAQGNLPHVLEVSPNEAVQLTLVRASASEATSYETAYALESDYTVYWGTPDEWSAYNDSVTASEDQASLVTDSNGNVSLSFDSPGSYYVWAEGGKSRDTIFSIYTAVNGPSVIRVDVASDEAAEAVKNAEDALAQLQSALDAANLAAAKATAALKATQAKPNDAAVLKSYAAAADEAYKSAQKAKESADSVVATAQTALAKAATQAEKERAEQVLEKALAAQEKATGALTAAQNVKRAADSSLAKLSQTKAKNTFTVKAKTKKAISVKRGKGIAAKKYLKLGKRAFGGKVTYKKINKAGGKKITVNAKTGKITIKKKAKKGVYTVKVQITSAASSTYSAVSKTVKVKVRVR